MYPQALYFKGWSSVMHFVLFSSWLQILHIPCVSDEIFTLTYAKEIEIYAGRIGLINVIDIDVDITHVRSINCSIVCLYCV